MQNEKKKCKVLNTYIENIKLKKKMQGQFEREEKQEKDGGGGERKGKGNTWEKKRRIK